MLNYLPPFLRKSPIYQEIFNADEQQFTILNTSIDDIKAQLDIDTATWGLAIYEKEFGIKTDLSKPQAVRRSVIKSKWRGSGKVDSLQIKLVADAYTNGDVVVSFNGHIVVKFTAVRGVPQNLDDLKRVIEEVKPAHLAIDYQYTYLHWDELDASCYSWDDLDRFNMTWDSYEKWNPTLRTSIALTFTE